jgi:hypothetical protein
MLQKPKQPRKNHINQAVESYIVESTLANNGMNSSKDVRNEVHRLFKKSISSASVRRLRKKNVMLLVFYTK